MNTVETLDKLVNRIKWISTALIVVGSILMAMNIFPWAFMVMSVASASWALAAWLSDDKPLLAVNSWMVVMQAIAFTNYITS